MLKVEKINHEASYKKIEVAIFMSGKVIFKISSIYQKYRCFTMTSNHFCKRKIF